MYIQRFQRHGLLYVTVAIATNDIDNIKKLCMHAVFNNACHYSYTGQIHVQGGSEQIELPPRI